MHILNYHAFLPKYDYLNWVKVPQFIEKLPQEHREEAKSIVTEGHWVDQTLLQLVLDSPDMAACSVATLLPCAPASGILKKINSMCVQMKPCIL